ncbi:transposase [Agarivorans sp. Z349TD_8]|uniref:transposase n=1 Tax=Agarivorans sp. Z349TD_8 TaxID=3421434 RepID=UPI003F6AB3E9
MDLKVFAEGESRVRKHGKEKRRIWRKVHLAVDADTHEVVSMVASLNSEHDGNVYRHSQIRFVVK